MDLDDWGPLITVIAALVVIIGMIFTLVIQRRTSRRIVEQARRLADAGAQSADRAAQSAAAADRSSQAAEEAVGLNRETAVQVANRVTADVFAQRYQDAASQLGHDKAAVRLAGAYAMARLADDWSQQRQSCVDVLCAYLRMPAPDETTSAANSEQQVRVTILRLIGEHLDARRPVTWCDCTFDFAYAELPMLLWSEPTFSTRPVFSHAHFTDVVVMRQPTFHQGVSFGFARFEGPLQIERAHVVGGDIVLYGADLRAGVVTTESFAETSTISLTKTVCRGEFGVVCSATASGPQGRVALREVLVKSGATLTMEGVDQSAAEGSAGPGATSHPGAVINVEPEGHVQLPASFKEFSGNGVYNDVWKN